LTTARVGVVALGLVSALAMATPAESLEVRVVAVRAFDRGPSDKDLMPLRARLRRLVGYRAFQVVQSEQRQCAWRAEEEFALPGGRWLHLLPKGMNEQAVMMQVRLLDGRRRLVDTHVRLNNRGTIFLGVPRSGRDIGAPPAGQDGQPSPGALLILIRAEE
jgi:hypothetical protein